MKRKIVRKKQDKKIFARTAARVEKKNLLNENMRGGIRL